MTTVDFYYDVVSPWAYLSFVILLRYKQRWNIKEMRLRPVFLGGVMQASGNKPPISIPNKGKWMQRDMAFCSKYYQIECQTPPKFPVNTIHAMRFLRVLQEEKPELLGEVSAKFWQASMVPGKVVDIAKVDNFPKILENVKGLDNETIKDILARSTSAENKDRMKAEANALVNDLDAFGMPWMVFHKDDGEKMAFWGNDRFEYVGVFLGIPWIGPMPEVKVLEARL